MCIRDRRNNERLKCWASSSPGGRVECDAALQEGLNDDHQPQPGGEDLLRTPARAAARPNWARPPPPRPRS
eukprot:5395908-Alexandrium_andersonii.AAC.1